MAPLRKRHDQDDGSGGCAATRTQNGAPRRARDATLQRRRLTPIVVFKARDFRFVYAHLVDPFEARRFLTSSGGGGERRQQRLEVSARFLRATQKTSPLARVAVIAASSRATMLVDARRTRRRSSTLGKAVTSARQSASGRVKRRTCASERREGRAITSPVCRVLHPRLRDLDTFKLPAVVSPRPAASPPRRRVPVTPRVF